MCGIYALLRNDWTIKKGDLIDINFIYDLYDSLRYRGPDYSTLNMVNKNVVMGFHRLSIVDTSPKSHQPLVYNGVYLICNGEIFNHLLLENEFKFREEMYSGSDCEVIIHLYLHFYKLFRSGEKAIRKTLELLDAEFAFVLYDSRINYCYAARDPFGVRPLFYNDYDNSQVVFSSELKGLPKKHYKCFKPEYHKPFLPGYFLEINLNEKDNHVSTLSQYYKISLEKSIPAPSNETAKLNINKLLQQSVKKRLMSDRPIGCFLSGGLDSSLVTALVHKHLPNVQCFSIGLKGSIDVQAAKKVVQHLGIPSSNHHVVNFTIEEGFNVLRDVIYSLETYDITTIRASTPQYLLSKYISENTDIKVLYSGEGADECWMGYLYSRMIEDPSVLEKESKRLMEELYMFDNLRVDRTTATWGLEVRIPFLDTALVDYIFGLSAKHRICSKSSGKIEKKILRDSFYGTGLLPDEILYRKKEAFSDAVSSKGESWYGLLAEKFIEPLVSDKDLRNAHKKFPFNTPQTKEGYYYRKIFETMFMDQDHVISHYWMPPESIVGKKITDPSATILDCYDGKL